MRRITVLCSVLVCLMFSGIQADVAHCPSVSGGVETTTPGPSFHNIGQRVIGISSNASVTALQGSLYCLRVHTTCLLGDVDGDGRINGDDIDDYVRVTFTGIGTPREHCAADLTPAAFVGLLLTV